MFDEPGAGGLRREFFRPALRPKHPVTVCEQILSFREAPYKSETVPQNRLRLSAAPIFFGQMAPQRLDLCGLLLLLR